MLWVVTKEHFKGKLHFATFGNRVVNIVLS